jgi:hypothetical protein
MTTDFKKKAQEEAARQERLDDARFLRGPRPGDTLYLFELRVPGRALSDAGGRGVTLFYPMVISPESYTMEEGFAISLTPGLRGGLAVEENGVVQRKLRIAGTTGFAPKKLRADAFPNMTSKAGASHAGMRGGPIWSGAMYSGQRHFHMLQDRVFRLYGDLKRDPNYAADVELYFHNLRDEEHWRVVPEQFNMSRRGFLYAYEISLIIVGPGNKPDVTSNVDGSPEAAVIGSAATAAGSPAATAGAATATKKKTTPATAAVKDTQSWYRNFINNVRALAGTIRQFAADLQGYVTLGLQLVEEAVALVEQITNAVLSYVSLFVGALDALASLARRIESFIEGVVSAILNFPDLVKQAWFNLVDALHLGAAFGDPEATISGASAGLSSSDRRSAQDINTTPNTLRAATGGTESSEAVRRSGTALTTAEIVALRNRLNTIEDVPAFSSLEDYAVGNADTLTSISLRAFGSPKFGWVIAELNGLRPPYISAVPLPGTVRPGERIALPSLSTGTSGDMISSYVRAESTASRQTQLFFRDAKIGTSSRYSTKVDLVLDATKGNRSVETVEGLANLQQAIKTRLAIQLGQSVLFPTLGMERLIGLNDAEVDAEILRIGLQRTLQADGRVQTIPKIRLTRLDSLDGYEAVIDVVPRSVPSTVQVTADVSL